LTFDSLKKVGNYEESLKDKIGGGKKKLYTPGKTHGVITGKLCWGWNGRK